MISFIRTKKGFTLIEATVAALLVGIGIVGLMAAFASGLILLESSHNMAVASSDARSVFEEMRRSAGSGLNPVVTKNWTAWAQGNGLTTLTNEQITVAFENPNADPVQATVTVRWSERNRNRQANFVGLVTRR
ncbi:MAG: type II secretion system protein [Candidatus Omnitrophica bacterium]|nr:type II secretion system protein [Candidatus Omnitrophota bacterium]